MGGFLLFVLPTSVIKTTVLLVGFIYEPFPVESSLHEQLTDHLNAEIVAKTIRRSP